MLHPLGLLINYSKYTIVMEPLKTDYKNGYIDQNTFKIFNQTAINLTLMSQSILEQVSYSVLG